MKVSELLDQVVGLLGIVAKKSVKHAKEAETAMEECRKLQGWVYPALTTEDIQKVVRCKNCMWYKKYKKKDDRKSLPVWMCSKDRIKRDPDFYCKGGEEK